MGMVIVLCLPSEIICSSALQREGKIMQCQSGNKVETVQEFKSCLNSLHIEGTKNSNYPAGSLPFITQNQIVLF